MNINPLSPISAPTVTSQVPSVTSSPAFKNLLKTIALQNQSQGKDPAKVKEARDAAAGLVSTALIMPILKQVRRSQSNSKGPFSPGTGEKAFGPEFDMQLSDRIAHSPRLGITNALAARLLKHGTPAKAAATKGLNLHG